MSKTKTKKKGKSQSEIYEEITNKVIASLENGDIPWNQPWISQEGFCNYVSKRHYRGINPLILSVVTSDKGYETPYWLTFNQAEELSIKKFLKENGLSDNADNRKKYDRKKDYTGVKKGEKSTIIVWWSTFEVEDEDEEDGKKTIPFLKYIPVFNTDQTDLGITYEAEKVDEEFSPIEKAAKVIDDWEDKPTINHLGYDRAYYVPDKDTVELPKQESFKSPELYYKTLYHECIHSTGHKKRLGRVKDWAKFGTDPYAKEELVAELGASFLMNYAGIENQDTEKNTEAYIKNWIKILKDNPKMIVQAGGKAQKGVDYITGTEYEPPENDKE